FVFHFLSALFLFLLLSFSLCSLLLISLSLFLSSFHRLRRQWRSGALLPYESFLVNISSSSSLEKEKSFHSCGSKKSSREGKKQRGSAGEGQFLRSLNGKYPSE